MEIEISLIIATYNRSTPLSSLLNKLKHQTINNRLWEVLVAVDGSCDDTITILRNISSEGLLPLTWFYQKNAGQCVARHNAIMKCNGKKIIIIDDDIHPTDTFVESHLNALNSAGEKAVVIGKVVPTQNWESRPLYELVREYSTAVMHEKFQKGIIRPNGEAFVTQNVSFYKKLYMEAGGFDSEMRLGEDTLLGMCFERAGARFVFCANAWAIHESNIGSYAKWLNRQYEYGKYAWVAWKKLDYCERLHPLKAFCFGNMLNRWLVLISCRSDKLIDFFVERLKNIGIILRKLSFLKAAVATHKAIISLKQHQGIRDAYGSWGAFRKAEKEYKRIMINSV